MILHNGPIYTMDPRLPHVGALSIAEGKVMGGVDVREGEIDTVGHERIDLDGRTVLPGLDDCHVHFRTGRSSAAARPDRQRLAGRDLRRVARRRPRRRAWLFGQGWRPRRGRRAADAALLDEVCGDRPVALWAHDRHTLCCPRAPSS